MKKNKILREIFFIIITFLVTPLISQASDYDCYYISKIGTTTAGYDIKEVKTNFISSNDKVTIIKYKGKTVNKATTSNKSSNGYVTDACYEYLYITTSSVSTSHRTTYHFRLGNSVTDFSTASDSGVLLKLNGFSSSDTNDDDIIKKHSNHITGSGTNYNNNLNSDLNLGFSYSAYFNYYTYGDGTRQFCITYKSQDACSKRFNDSNVGTVKTAIVNNSGSEVSFTISSDYIDAFFNGSVDDTYFNFSTNGTVYTLISDRSSDNINYQEPGEIISPELAIDDIKFCDSNGVLKSFQIIGYLLYVAKLVIPLLLIILGSIDFAKATISSSDKAPQEALISLTKRVILGIIIFIIPTVLDFLLGLVDGASDAFSNSKVTKCTSCLLDPLGDCQAEDIDE